MEQSYKEKYEQALRVAKETYDKQPMYREWLEKMFPELKESEDEKIREALIRFHKSTIDIDGIKGADIISWLEKQGEQKPTKEKMISAEESLGIDSDTYNKIVDECIYGDDKVEPKFHEGEWITNSDYTWKIVEVKPLDYILQSQDGNIVDDTISHVDEQFHSFTIQDAKDGDVLYECNEKKSFIFKELKTKHIDDIASYCDIFNGIFNPNEDSWTTLDIVPATKEQRDLLFQKMHEAGYMWDSDSKQLLSLKAEPSGEQKLVDEDIKALLRTEYEKGRADAIAEMQKEWSKEDKSKRNALIGLVEEIKRQPLKRLEDWDGYISWLKSLRPQNRWRPSEEQMIALKDALNDAIWKYDFKGSPIKEEVTRKHAETIESLYNDLKKLREE